MTDAELIAMFLAYDAPLEEREEAFRKIVDEHSTMVYSACLRGLDGDTGLAQDAAQAVFIALAQKARLVRKKYSLGCWLFGAALNAVSHIRREESRRKRREKEAVQMMSQAANVGKEDPAWNEARLRLNKAVEGLRPKTREAVVLYYLEGKNQGEVAERLGCSEDAAKKRIQYGLSKLREHFRKNGVILSSAALASLLGGSAAYASVPAGFAGACQAAAIAGLTGGATATGGAYSIAQGVSKMMMWAKIKAVAAICTVTIAVGGAGTYGVAKFMMAADAGNANERLILGFEPNGPPCFTKPQYPSQAVSAKGDATEGEYAGKWTVDQKQSSAFRPGEPDNPVWWHTMANNARINTHGWFDKFIPHDWSGYNALLLDFKSTDAQAKIMIGLEDDDVYPAIFREYDVPPGKWVTLEIDLDKCVAERKFNLKNAVNFWVVLVNCSGPSSFLADNIRLAKTGYAAKNPVIKDEKTPYLPSGVQGKPFERGFFRGPFHKPPEYPADVKRGDAKPAMSPIADDKPIVVEPKFGEKPPPTCLYNPRNGVLAFDNDHLLLLISNYFLQSADGGKTWTGLGGKEAPQRIVWSGGTKQNAEGGADGPDALIVYHGACSNDPIPSARTWLKRIVFNGKSWEPEASYNIELDTRGCIAAPASIITRAKSGKLWCAWDAHPNRLGGGQMWISCSGDNGKNWGAPDGNNSSAKSHLVAGAVAGIMQMAPFGEEAMCVWASKSKKLTWSAFDQKAKAWSAPAPVGGGGYPRSMVSVGYNEVFLSTSEDKVWRFKDGAWTSDAVPGSQYAFFTRAGDKMFLVGAEIDFGDLRYTVYKETSAKKILLWKYQSGKWSTPKEIVTETAALSSLAVPVESPVNFVPVAWTGFKQSWVKVLRVPVQ